MSRRVPFTNAEKRHARAARVTSSTFTDVYELRPTARQMFAHLESHNPEGGYLKHLQKQKHSFGGTPFYQTRKQRVRPVYSTGHLQRYKQEYDAKVDARLTSSSSVAARQEAARQKARQEAVMQARMMTPLQKQAPLRYVPAMAPARQLYRQPSAVSSSAAKARAKNAAYGAVLKTASKK